MLFRSLVYDTECHADGRNAQQAGKSYRLAASCRDTQALSSRLLLLTGFLNKLRDLGVGADRFHNNDRFGIAIHAVRSV